ncbi:hypothetical protein [Streptomyces sp. NRRL F-4489]|uniref:hypothetical protein n=1 Tax=Streptomyces sp. NRRL F-4489 TaxID=1609095 RepID=UPI000B200FF6|nr:hypothetical protein [Streptomyces sp. NRRL F-4489]
MRRLPTGALCGAPVEGQAYRVELNQSHILDLWRCGPCAIDLDRALLETLSDADGGGKPLRGRRYMDQSGVLASSDDIRAWFELLVQNSPDLLPAEHVATIKSWSEAPPTKKLGRVSNELVELWERLRPELHVEANWDPVSPTQAFEGLRAALIEDPTQFTVQERAMIMGLRSNEVPPIALQVYGRIYASQQRVDQLDQQS